MSEIEAKFDFNELFVSITDKRGVILSGNEVFVRVSGYQRSDMIGAPHNIIRHPGTPKCVFKLLWSTIQADKPILAYVKNKTKDGLPYWVFASVYPIAEGYLSVRIKPGSPLLDQIKVLYEELVQVEKSKGVAASEELLKRRLLELGFNDYHEFSLAAAKAELTHKQSTISSETSKAQEAPQFRLNQHTISEETRFMSGLCGRNNEEFIDVSRDFDHVFADSDAIRTNLSSIIQSIRRFESLSVNMSLASHRLGSKGQTLATVAERFERCSQVLLGQVDKFEQFNERNQTKVKELNHVLNRLRLLNEMLEFYTREVADASSRHAMREIPNWQMIQNDFTIMIREVISLFQETNQHTKRAIDELNDFQQVLKSSRIAIRNLDIVRITGKLESASSAQLEKSFQPYVEEMLGFIELTDRNLSGIEEAARHYQFVYDKIRTLCLKSTSRLLELELRNLRVRFIETTPNKPSEAA